MILSPTAIAGVLDIRTPKARDERGAFLRLYCRETFAAAGTDFVPVQASLSENLLRHTLRGMHWQAAPSAERKLVRCARGAILDVALDLRPGSATWLRHIAVELRAEDSNALLIPPGCAHGFLTLTDDAAVEYMMDVPHAPALARGARWDDPAFGIVWPAPPAVISDRDRTWPDFDG